MMTTTASHEKKYFPAAHVTYARTAHYV